MTRKEAHDYILNHATDLLTPDRTTAQKLQHGGEIKYKGYICPVCGSGSGRHGTGMILGANGHTFTCFANGCINGTSGGDIFEVIGAANGLRDYNEQLNECAALLGIKIDGKSDTDGAKRQRTERKAPVKAEPEPQETDYTNFILQAHEHLTDTDYHRGISVDTLNRFKVGYVPNWKSPTAGDRAPTSARLIVPTSRYSYLARATDTDGDGKALKAGKVRLFNGKALAADTPVIITEGEIDSMSVEDVGGRSVGLGGAGNTSLLLDALSAAEPPKYPLILALDNDERGIDAQKKLIQGLQALNIPFIEYNISGVEKDPNDALQRDRATFTAAVKAAERAAEQAQQEILQAEQAAKDAERAAYISQYSAGGQLDNIIQSIADSRSMRFISTGFKQLDAKLEGGMTEGLYTIGAPPATGKTTAVLQIADYIAGQGHDVLYFCLEMSTREMVGRSISRRTCKRVLQGDAGGHICNAKSTLGILIGSRYDSYSAEEKQLITDATRDYSKVASHLYFVEHGERMTALDVRATVDKHYSITGNRPVVIIDYLQLITPMNEKATEKMNTDSAIIEFKRISHDYSTSVIVISAFNRSNYQRETHESAFKESGGIEYTADVLLGLNFKGVEDSGFNLDTAKQQNPREMEIKIIKNRNGAAGAKLYYKYYPAFNLFQEVK